MRLALALLAATLPALSAAQPPSGWLAMRTPARLTARPARPQAVRPAPPAAPEAAPAAVTPGARRGALPAPRPLRPRRRPERSWPPVR